MIIYMKAVSPVSPIAVNAWNVRENDCKLNRKKKKKKLGVWKWLNDEKHI